MKIERMDESVIRFRENLVLLYLFCYKRKRGCQLSLGGCHIAKTGVITSLGENSENNF